MLFNIKSIADSHAKRKTHPRHSERSEESSTINQCNWILPTLEPVFGFPVEYMSYPSTSSGTKAHYSHVK